MLCDAIEPGKGIPSAGNAKAVACASKFVPLGASNPESPYTPSVLSLRQRDELGLIARHPGEPPFFPITFGLLDSRRRAGHEIPPEVPLPVERRSAKDCDARVGGRAQRDFEAFGENQHAAAFSTLVAADNRTLDDISGALLMLARDGEFAAGRHRDIGVEARRS